MVCLSFIQVFFVFKKKETKILLIGHEYYKIEPKQLVVKGHRFVKAKVLRFSCIAIGHVIDFIAIQMLEIELLKNYSQ